MRLYYLQRAVAVGFLGCAVTFQGACGGGVRDVRAWRLHNDGEHQSLSGITEERIKGCMSDYVSQFTAEHNEIRAEVDVDENRNRTVMIDGVPETSPDFGSCVRLALSDMSINEELFRQGVKELHQKREQASAEQRKFVGNPIVIVIAGVTIIVSEVMVEAGLYTVMVAVTVKVVDKAAEDVAELAKRGFKQCVTHYTACMATSLSNRGNHWKASVCNTCFEVCDRTGAWPASIGLGSCNYWERSWGQ